MKHIATLLLTLTVVGAAATSSSTSVRVRAVKGVESSRKLYGGYNNGGYDSYNSYYPSDDYSSSGGGGGGGSSSSHHHSAPKPKPKQTPKPKTHPKPKTKPSSHSSSSSGGGGGGGGGGSSSGYYSSYDSNHSDYYEVGYGAVGALGLAAAFLAKKKCSSQNNEESRTIDASDILQGDHVKEESSVQSDDTLFNFEMTGSEQEKPTRSSRTKEATSGAAALV